MLDLQATCISMPRFVGELILSRPHQGLKMPRRPGRSCLSQRMVQLLPHFRFKEREKSRTHIGSILKLKQSKLPSQPKHFVPTDNSFDRAEIVRWVLENTRPFSIVSDRGFKNLMKTRWPEYYLPSPSTVSRDVRVVFARSCQRIAALLWVSDKISESIPINIHWQKHDGKLHFATDAWTSPNYCAFVVVMIHFEHKESPICMILDVVEVAKVRFHNSSSCDRRY